MHQSNSALCRPGGGCDDGGLQCGYMTYAGSGVMYTLSVHTMATNLYLAWATDKEHEKEHVSFSNFVKKFDITDKKSANEAFLSLISSPRLRETRRKRLQDAYKKFRERHEDIFWERRALKVADRRLLINCATIAKETAVIAQKASIKETSSGFRRYQSNSKTIEDSDDEVIDDDVTDSEGEAETNANSADRLTVEEQGSSEVDVTKEDLIRAKSTPFYELIHHVFKKMRGESSMLPDIPRSYASKNHSELAKRAREELEKADDVSRDTLVLLSGIINTLSPGSCAFTLSPEVKSQSLVPSLSQKLPVIENLMSELLSALCPGLDEDPYAESTLIGLQLKVMELLQQSLGKGATGRTKDQKAVHVVLMIMNHICSLMATEQLAPPLSEHAFVSAWAYIFNVLFHSSKVRAMPGELTSTATRRTRLMVEEEFGATNRYICGRKVDMSIRVYADHTWENEICVCELKSANASKVVCEQQQRKSVRLNGAILLELEERGLDICNSYPIIAEGRGLVMDFYTLRRYDDILGSGRSTLSDVWLPSHESQLKQFLKSDSLHVLLAFAI
ncbi:hypothetical protein BGZ94_009868 [Podila epigama]|nr:hypothetical protein BGZ94_009868 [Podila epigama]